MTRSLTAPNASSVSRNSWSYLHINIPHTAHNNLRCGHENRKRQTRKERPKISLVSPKLCIDRWEVWSVCSKWTLQYKEVGADIQTGSRASLFVRRQTDWNVVYRGALGIVPLCRLVVEGRRLTDNVSVRSVFFRFVNRAATQILVKVRGHRLVSHDLLAERSHHLTLFIVFGSAATFARTLKRQKRIRQTISGYSSPPSQRQVIEETLSSFHREAYSLPWVGNPE